MHEDQIDVGEQQVVALVAEQIPELAGMEVVRVRGSGTVHAIFRVGDAVTARFPLRAERPDRIAERLRLDAAASLEFHDVAGVAAPRPLGIWRPGHGYPSPWMTQSWVPGTIAGPTTHQHDAALADDLVELVSRLRDAPVRGRRFTGSGRGGHLPDHDAWVAECITESEGLLDTAAMRALWSRSRSLPREDPDRMCHGDLIPANLLVAGGRLAGVLDSGGFAAADPALDLVAAWHLFEEAPRERIRRALGCSDLQWERGAAWAFQQALGAYWYYLRTNAAMAEMGRTTLSRLAAAAESS